MSRRLKLTLKRKKKLYFLHIPKTAGTSVNHTLRQIAIINNLNMFGPALIDDLVDTPNWKNSDFLSGHFGLLPLDHKFTFFTILRDPLERLYSHYSHVKRDINHYFYKFVAGEDLSFLDYLLDQRFYNLNYNLQTRYLSTSPELDNSLLYHRLLTPQAYRFENSTHLNVSLERALRTLDDALWVGDTENLMELEKFLKKRLSTPNIEIPYLNLGPKQREFSYLEIKAAKPLLELDTYIYRDWQSSNRLKT